MNKWEWINLSYSIFYCYKALFLTISAIPRKMTNNCLPLMAVALELLFIISQAIIGLIYWYQSSWLMLVSIVIKILNRSLYEWRATKSILYTSFLFKISAIHFSFKIRLLHCISFNSSKTTNLFFLSHRKPPPHFTISNWKPKMLNCNQSFFNLNLKLCSKNYLTIIWLLPVNWFQQYQSFVCIFH